MRHYAVSLLVLGIGQQSWAANICNETVPSNRIIDGIPAYQQCTDSSNTAIYSNNGVDTAGSSGGSDWVRTQGNGGYQCTELAHRYLYFKWGVRSVPNGNAGVWCDGTIPSGLEKKATPVHGDVIVFAPGSCGADQTTGHVAVVDVVNANETVTFVEQNRAGRRSCATNTAACFLHAIANTGMVVDGGTIDGSQPDSGTVVAPDGGARPDRAADNRPADRPGSGGAVGTGGTTGAGGVSGSGGTSGSGPVFASGGQTGSGGATAVTGSGGQTAADTSTGGSGGAVATGPSPGADNGCACHLADGRSADAGAGLLALLALVFAMALFRRRTRS
jgi:surface antigen